VKGSLVYFISHNIARRELLPDGRGGFAGEGCVHRKGATRAFPAGHPSLKDTPFAGRVIRFCFLAILAREV
jgi:tRNA-splicing ligase RtcB